MPVSDVCLNCLYIWAIRQNRTLLYLPKKAPLPGAGASTADRNQQQVVNRALKLLQISHLLNRSACLEGVKAVRKEYHTWARKPGSSNPGVDFFPKVAWEYDQSGTQLKSTRGLQNDAFCICLEWTVDRWIFMKITSPHLTLTRE